MRTEEEIFSELKTRCQYTLKQNESYSGYRSNMNFVRGMLFCLGVNVPKNCNLKTTLEQVKGIKSIKELI